MNKYKELDRRYSELFEKHNLMINEQAMKSKGR